MGIFDNAISVVIGNKIVDSITTSDNGVIYQRSEHTRLSIDLPLNLTYSDAFNISGNLTASDGSTGISGEEVLLKVDGNVMASATTSNNGEYSFTQTPVSSGNHTFQVVYAGSNSYGSSESSTVTRTVGKETTIITATVDQTKYDVGDTITVTATLTDDDGNAITGLSRKVIIYGYYPDNLNSGVAKGYMTPTNDGQYTFSFTYVNATQSGVRVSVAFNGDSNYTSSSSSIIDLNIVTPTVISATATNPVLTTGDSSTVTATVIDQDGDAIKNRAVSYTVLHGSTTLDSGSATTNNNGEITLPTYTGTSLGKIDYVLTCGSLSSTYSIYDVLKYDMGTEANPNDSFWASVSNIARGEEYSSIGSSSVMTAYSEISGDIIIECDLKTDTFGGGTVIRIQQDSNVLSDLTRQTLSMNQNEWTHIKMIISDNKLTVNGTDISNVDITGFNRMYLRANANYHIYFKNFKIYSPFVNPLPTNIVMTGSTDTVTTNETTTITAKVKNSEGYNINGMSVKFYENNVLADTVTTSGGKAEYTYTGSGTGLINIKAECESIEQTYTVYDALKYDIATQSSPNNSFWASTSNIARYEGYSTIGSSESTSSVYSSITGDICIECDVRTDTFTTGTVIRIQEGSTLLSDLTRSVLGLNQNEWKHIKLQIEDNKLSVDGTSVSDVDITGYNRFYFRSNSGYNIDFKNIKVYSI